MPLLWKADVIGWVNATRSGNEVSIEAGFVNGKPPSEKSLHSAFEVEAERLRQFFSSTEPDQ
jgi:hypothetical protein